MHTTCYPVSDAGDELRRICAMCGRHMCVHYCCNYTLNQQQRVYLYTQANRKIFDQIHQVLVVNIGIAQTGQIKFEYIEPHKKEKSVCEKQKWHTF